MARVTPAQILALGEPMEDVYNEIVDELLVNIGRHLRGNTTTWTAYWELEKLEEMGQLTAENAAIINRHIERMPQILKDTMEDSRKLALSDIESKLAKAAAAGYVTKPITDSSVEVLRNYINQAEEKLNLTNTIMLQSSVDMYQQAVGMTEERAQEIRATGELIEGKVAGKIATGTYARQKALNETIQKLSDAGLTGFYDRAGRSWSPEAYVNMVTRTTVHNVAIESTKARMQDYGTDVFQVSSHAGARPLCYPYQGKFYSWGGSSGTVELGNGQTVKYEPLSSTSYGEPAGLFGVNCGHYPLPIIPGVSIPHGADNIEPQPQNDQNYQETQQQRALERQIREAKRVVEMEGSLATDKQRERVTQLEAKMKQFTNETGRTRRYDRERVYVAKDNKKKTQVQTTGPSTVVGSVGNKAVKAVQSGKASITAVSSELPRTLSLPDIRIGHSVGAKKKNEDVLDLLTGERYSIVEGSHISNVKVFAGKGTSKPYEMAWKYARDFGGNAEDWQHVKGDGWLNTSDGDRFAEIHWSQREGSGRVDMFLKKWKD